MRIKRRENEVFVTELSDRQLYEAQTFSRRHLTEDERRAAKAAFLAKYGHEVAPTDSVFVWA